MAEVEDDGHSKKMFGPLLFEERNLEKYTPLQEQECLLCNLKFSLKNQIDLFVKHIFDVHSLVIEDFQGIDRLDKYVAYWKEKFQTTTFETIVPSVKIEGTTQHYFILSDLMKEDKQIRHKLKLEATLEQQEHERLTINFKRSCMFCKLEYEGKLYEYVQHLSNQHNLQLGRPENLVFIVEFLNAIEEKINSLKCIYCEKTFTDRNVLKEHMRKKLHKRINASNRFYDKFYIVNYLESGRNWQNIQKEDDVSPITLDNNSDQEWSDWEEKDQEAVCLFCDYKDLSIINICTHMNLAHNFDFQATIASMDFYQKVKLVNYIRRQIHICHCVQCDKKYETKNELQEHLKNENHCSVPDAKVFDQPEYYFPTYENDTLLYYLEEINENDVLY